MVMADGTAVDAAALARSIVHSAAVPDNANGIIHAEVVDIPE